MDTVSAFIIILNVDSEVVRDSSNAGSKGQTKRPASTAKEGNRVDPRSSTIDNFFSAEKPSAPSVRNGRLPPKVKHDAPLDFHPAHRSNSGYTAERRRPNFTRIPEAGIRGEDNGYRRIGNAGLLSVVSLPGPSTTEILLPICAEEINAATRSTVDIADTSMARTFQTDRMSTIDDKILFQDVLNGTTEGARRIQWGKAAKYLMFYRSSGGQFCSECLLFSSAVAGPEHFQERSLEVSAIPVAEGNSAV